MRDHNPITIDQFNGLWDRGDPDTTPIDHFQECENIKFVGTNGFATRDGVGLHQSVAAPLSGILRFYNFPTQDKQTLLVLTTGGNIYHVVDAATIHGPILTIPTMTDFGFAPYAGRAYITPFTTEVVGGLNRERGLQNQFLYVYKGDGTAARKAAGPTPAGTITVANGANGHTDAGTHIFGVVGETDTGYQSAPVAFASFVTGASLSVSFTNVPVFVGTFWTKRHLVASKVIQNYNGDIAGYDFFFIPGAIINDNVTTSLANVSFYDQDLLLDASHLIDNFAEIPAVVGLTLYHNRLILYTEYNNISLVRVSAVGEPEAFNQINGLLIVPPDGNPITNAQELRDVLYVMKRARTIAFTDNGDVPTSWPMTIVDNALGCGVHGIATVIDSGSASTDYLVVGTFQGVTLFNGRYILPELSWKVQDLWIGQSRNDWRRIQMLNDPIFQNLYIVMTDRRVLHANYANGFDPKKIRWTPWRFDMLVNTLALININDLLLGTDQV